MTAPRLRFGSFKGSWERKTLAELGNFKRSYSLSRDSEGAGEYHHIHYGDIHSLYKGIVDFNSNIPSITAKGPFECASDGDVIFADASEDYKDLGKAVVVVDLQGKKVISGLHTHRFRPTEKLDPFFLLYFSQTSVYQSFVRKMGTGISVLGISKTNLSSLNIALPQIKEQQKIGSFFLLLDKKIDKQQEKIEQLELFKKGMMQKIFSREIRFKDENGKEFPEWKTKKLNDLLEIRDERQIPTDDAPLMAFTSTGGVEEKGDRYDRLFLVKDKNKKYKRTELNDLIYSSNNLDVGAIGLNKYGTAVISDVYEIFVAKPRIIPEFLDVMVRQKFFLNKILRYRQGALYGQYRIHADDFLSVEVTIPSIEEQKKIGMFFSHLDQRINIEKESQKELQKLKKGLMQQMFI